MRSRTSPGLMRSGKNYFAEGAAAAAVGLPASAFFACFFTCFFTSVLAGAAAFSGAAGA